jgi:cullin-4
MSADVYQKLKALVEEHVKRNINQFIETDADHDLFLRLMNDAWDAHCEQMKMIRHIFLFLDRTYVLQNASVVSIW